MADTKVTIGVPLFVVGALVMLWTSVSGQGSTLLIGAGFLSAVVLTVGTIFLGLSGSEGDRVV
ncbi:hypothetical protein [Halocalculus aciditolerans]|uniref:Uncharacterized protein n=1 Tax=Halocalculus aciditolerans TaxID=1383812 RepID=A0A830F7P1_9EURY|nr:hypothetical protein [Halocalculus aciditolerans]GGL62797.1 hypothetical protein GCM10009039_20920 [Halocalculus aciditolerans]